MCVSSFFLDIQIDQATVRRGQGYHQEIQTEAETEIITEAGTEIMREAEIEIVIEGGIEIVREAEIEIVKEEGIEVVREAKIETEPSLKTITAPLEQQVKLIFLIYLFSNVFLLFFCL